LGKTHIRIQERTVLENDPLWYKDAIIYEVHVRAYKDSVGDGGGDFRGLAEKLDYLQDLGVTAIWLLPFYPSPLKDDGYDIADYTSINPDYGSLRDFKNFLQGAHARGIRVITELVVNHTSDQHPWFQRARRAPPGSVYRDFYVWSETPEKYKEARIIFQDFEASNWTWDPVAKAYYWHRFYSHQPDLNFDNLEVWKALFPVVDFWMDMGVDGMRLDAIPYLFEREGTNCENLPETHEFLQALRNHVDTKFANRMLLAEANQWPEDAVAYFGSGDECNMAFHFPVMPRLFMAIHMEDRFPIVDIMDQTPTIPENCQWCMFLRNHDELTLEMVTDEERDYMYRAYATDTRARINLGIRRRLAPLLGNNRRRIELMDALLLSMPGTPVLYYGDEIGMGDNIYLGDRNSVRTPMQWGPDRNAGFSRANPQQLYLPVIIDPEYHFEAVNVEAQQNNPNSLLWWTKRLIALRKQHKAFGRGSLQFLQPENRKILAFLRRYQDECLLVVANLSRFVQYVELNLAEFQGSVPVELFGNTAFPPIGKSPYLLSLAPHTFYWFTLAQQAVEPWETMTAPIKEMKPLPAPGGWQELLHNSSTVNLERYLVRFLKQRPWFGSKGRALKSIAIREVLPVTYGAATAPVLMIQAEFSEAAPDTYVLPLTFVTDERAERILTDSPTALVARVLSGQDDGYLVDALAEPQFCSMVLEAIRASVPFETGRERPTLVATALPSFGDSLPLTDTLPAPGQMRGEQSHSSVPFGTQAFLKVYRRVEEGSHPELEVGRFLTERRFPHTPPLLGHIEMRRRRGAPTVLAILLKYIPNQGEAWQYTLDELSSYFERALAERDCPVASGVSPRLTIALEQQPPELARRLIGVYLESAALLGRRIAEFHTVLSANYDDPAFAPEPPGKLYQRSVYQSLRNLVGKTLVLLRDRLSALTAESAQLAQRLLDAVPEVLHRFQTSVSRRLTGLRTRYHGDFHLGQALFTGKDFVIVDFEGEPARSLSDRRIKRSPLRDVAKMVLSLHNAAYCAVRGYESVKGRSPGIVRPEDRAALDSWAHFWFHWVCASFTNAYWHQAAGQKFLPHSAEEYVWQLEIFLFEKALAELGGELTTRPEWVLLPLLVINKLLQSHA
jgi:maltose alpha-D-glucosyltransferase/alpha-amylase